MQLLERGAALASLSEYAHEARHGDGRLVLVAGEAGVGKSALVEHLQDGLPDARWSWGACDGLSTPHPLGPLFDLAAQIGRELEELCRAGAPREDLFRALLRQVSDPGERAVALERTGRWDEAVALGTELLATASVSPLYRAAPLQALGVIRQARRAGRLGVSRRGGGRRGRLW